MQHHMEVGTVYPISNTTKENLALDRGNGIILLHFYLCVQNELRPTP